MSEVVKSILPPSSVDRRLLKAAAKYGSAQELSDAVLGQLTPAQALDRVKTILNEKTIYDEVEERRLLLIQMAEWADWLEGQKDNPKAWSAINRSLKLVSDQIERSNINLNDVSSRLAQDHATYFTEGFLLGLEKVLEILREAKGVDIGEVEIVDLAREGVEASREYLERVTLRPEVE